MMKLSPLGKEIRKLRIDRDVKMKWMADKMDISMAYVSGIETGVRRPTVKFVRSMADALSLTEQERQVVNEAYRKTLIDEFMDNLIDPL